ncbi:MAG: mandelate racemase/muconate lactonizing enzyme family protein [Dehalococcoidia bacterium]
MATPTIDSIELRHYRLPLEPPFHAAWDPVPRRSFASTIVRVSAGDYEGVGSGSAMAGFAGHEPLFVGHDPFDIERHVEVLDNLQFHYDRMWPLEVALWDLMGKVRGQPLWKLLGGERDSVPVYASTGARMSLDERVESALHLKALGFPAVKLRMYQDDIEDDLAIVRAVRDAVGPDLAIVVDANQGWRVPSDTRAPWSFDTALHVADELAELDVFWLEEPLDRHDYRGLAELQRQSRVRIAGGEGAREFAELREYLHHGSLDVYQADVAWSTGVLRARQLAAEALAAGALYSPHTWGDGLVLLANLHVAAAVSTAPFIEFAHDPPAWPPARRDFILPEPITASDGVVRLPDGPGLGVEIDWAALEPLRVEP